jgi:hypothetical protein
MRRALIGNTGVEVSLQTNKERLDKGKTQALFDINVFSQAQRI